MKKLASVDGKRWTFWKRFNISDRSGGVYLRRLRMVQTPAGSAYLHRIDAVDPDPHPHDHPWSFVSIVLRGGYTEHVYWIDRFGRVQVDRKRHRPFSIHFMPTTQAHRIVQVGRNCTTLILAGPRRREWGFWTRNAYVRGLSQPGDTGWVDWKTYLTNMYGTPNFTTGRWKEPLP